MQPSNQKRFALAARQCQHSGSAQSLALAIVALLSCTGLVPMAAFAGPAASHAKGAASPTPQASAPTTTGADDSLTVRGALARLAAAKSPEEIQEALSDLMLLQDPAAVAPVSKYLANPDADVADQAAATLESIGTPVAAAALEKALKLPLQPKIKSRVLDALYFNRTEVDALPGLLLGLQDATPSVRSDAAYYLGELGNKKALPQIRRQIARESDPSARKVMEWAAAFINDGTAARPPGS